MSDAKEPGPQAPAKKHFVVRLIPPRPTFAADMTEEERAIMAAHGAYWRGLMNRGIALLFGPVLDPAGVWGLGILEAKDPDAARARCRRSGDQVGTQPRGDPRDRSGRAWLIG